MLLGVILAAIQALRVLQDALVCRHLEPTDQEPGAKRRWRGEGRRPPNDSCAASAAQQVTGAWGRPWAPTASKAEPPPTPRASTVKGRGPAGGGHAGVRAAQGPAGTQLVVPGPGRVLLPQGPAVLSVPPEAALRPPGSQEVGQDARLGPGGRSHLLPAPRDCEQVAVPPSRSLYMAQNTTSARRRRRPQAGARAGGAQACAHRPGPRA